MRKAIVLTLLVLVGPLLPMSVTTEATAATPQPTHVATAAVARNSAAPWVSVPAQVVEGDRLVLYVAASASTTVGEPTGVTGWQSLGTSGPLSMRSAVWTKVASASDAGGRVTIQLGSQLKSTVVVAAYRGLGRSSIGSASAVMNNPGTTMASPQVGAQAEDLALTFWAGKPNAATSWTPPAGVTARGSAANTGSGRIVSLLVEATMAGQGSYGGIAATADDTMRSATSWTVVLPANTRPSAVWSGACNRLACSFDGSRSVDREGAIVDYEWAFGDGTSGAGVTPTHTYAAAGTYDVQLRVTDQDGAIHALTRPITATTGMVEVVADDETERGPQIGQADDPAIWVHPTDPSQSLVIGNEKSTGLDVYDLDGNRLQRVTTATTFWGNVDVRQDVTIGARTLDVVAAYNGGIRTYGVDAATRRLVPIGDGTGTINTGGGEGLCAYHSALTGDVSVFVITVAGRVRQYRIHDADGDGRLQGTMVREFQVGSEAEGCVADDATGALYVAEEESALWRYGAEPGDGSTRSRVDSVAPAGSLSPDIEGVTLVDTGNGQGYLVASASSSTDSTQSFFTVYDRHTNELAGSFRVKVGPANGGCRRTDGIAAYAGDLGAAYPQGMFVCQDSSDGRGSQAGAGNFKMVRLDKILTALSPQQ